MKPRVAITMGDPAGVGPEIVLKALARADVRDLCEPVVFGDLSWLSAVAETVFQRKGPGRVRLVRRGALVGPRPRPMAGRTVPVSDLANVPLDLQIGRVSAAAGRASGDYITAAVAAMQRGEVDALVTAPINKASFKLGGWGRRYVGHTEMLAALTKTKKFGLMLAHGPIRAVHVTSHVPLRRVAALVTRAAVRDSIFLAHEAMKAFGIRRPRVAVCGLNPHAGDGGVLGTEETHTIAPAVRDAVRAGIRAEGPLAADAVWTFLRMGRYDVAVAMYHDQGQIPVKFSAFAKGGAGGTMSGGVNVTLGLPIIRTSPAHGTAYDIAGTGRASEASLVEAISTACSMARSRRRR